MCERVRIAEREKKKEEQNAYNQMVGIIYPVHGTGVPVCGFIQGWLRPLGCITKSSIEWRSSSSLLLFMKFVRTWRHVCVCVHVHGWCKKKNIKMTLYFANLCFLCLSHFQFSLHTTMLPHFQLPKKNEHNKIIASYSSSQKSTKFYFVEARIDSREKKGNV